MAEKDVEAVLSDGVLTIEPPKTVKARRRSSTSP